MSKLNNNTAQLELLLAKVNALPEAGTGGTDTTDATITADEVFAGEVAYGSDGKVIGTFTIEDELSTQDNLISAIKTALNGKAIDDFSLQEKSVTPTKSQQVITHDSSYDGLSKVTVEAIPDDYIIPSGTLEVTENGDYNVTNYANVFVVVPESGGGGNNNDTRFADLVTDNITTVDDETITNWRPYAFCYCTNLKTVRLPKVTVGATCVFRYCSNLQSADLPMLAGTCGNYLFDSCTNLTSVNISKVTSLSTYTFQNCSALNKVDLGNLSSIASGACKGSGLETLIIRRTGTSATTLANVNAFENTPIGNGTGYIYVYSALIDKFKAATNWSSFANQIRAIEDYPEICG